MASTVATKTPITAPTPKIQNVTPTPTNPPGPGLVATNTQPVISATMMPSSATVLGETGVLGLVFNSPITAAPSRPSAPTSTATVVIRPNGAHDAE